MRPYFQRSDRVKHKPKKLSFQNLSGAFLLLLVGLCVALFVHISERILFYILTLQ